MNIFSNTNQGLKRISNQDNYVNKKISSKLLWSVVCDGMGGVNGGNVASAIATETAKEFLDEKFKVGLSDEEYADIAVKTIEESNRKIFNHSQKESDLKGMGTTMVVVLIVDKKAYISHVGDSRVYLKRGDEVNQITVDHSFVQDLLNRGEITKEEAKTHPHRNIITRSVGVYDVVKADIVMLELQKSDIIVACTDGLSTYLNEEKLGELLLENDKKVADTLVNYALECGGIDNITASVITV